MRIALYEPDIPQNTGTILRLCACLGLPADIIEPAGFPITDRAFRRAGMDYLDQVEITRHRSFTDFDNWRRHGGLKLVHNAADARLRIPIRPGLRSLNVAMAAAMVAGEALRQTGASPIG
jgi:tRNA (cytidine/uridine-2'-O-)-methyltransferase